MHGMYPHPDGLDTQSLVRRSPWVHEEASKGLDQLVNKFNVCLHAIARVLPYRVCYKLCVDVCHVWCKQTDTPLNPWRLSSCLFTRCPASIKFPCRRRRRNLRRTNSMIPIGPFPQRCQRTQGSITSQGNMQELLICCNDVCNQASSHSRLCFYISDAFRSEHTKIVSLMNSRILAGRALARTH